MRQFQLNLIFIFFSNFLFSQTISVYSGQEKAIKEIVKDKSNFEILPSQFVNLGTTNQSKFFLVSNIYNSQYAISVENPLLDLVEFYSLDNNNPSILKSHNLGYSQTLINEMGSDSLLIMVKSKTPIITPFSFKKLENIKRDNNEIENFFFFFIVLHLI